MDVIPGARAALAWWKAEAGDEESARALLAAFAGDGFAALPRDEDWLGGMAFLAMAAVALEQREYATTLYAMLLPYADLCLTIGNAAASLGSAHLYLARLAALTGLRDLALTHITAAIATNMRIGARVWLVESLVEHAAILLDGGSDDDALRAAELLAKAEAAAGSIGMGGTLRRIATLRRRAEVIGALGLSKRTPRSLPDGLTDREAEVLCLVAAGYTNRYIADTLVLSVRTVERHIAHVYAKTGARGRADATRYAVHHGLIPVTSLA